MALALQEQELAERQAEQFVVHLVAVVVPLAFLAHLQLEAFQSQVELVEEAVAAAALVESGEQTVAFVAPRVELLVEEALLVHLAALVVHLADFEIDYSFTVSKSSHENIIEGYCKIS